MKLDRLVLVNWGQIRPGEYDMGEMTLLTGQTGSGKSTMLDALQTVMTAAYQGIFNYNPGQDEVSQGQRRGKTKRTLESYVVGAEYSRFSRPDGAQGYMAAVFRPSPGEENVKAFTALVAAAARVDGTGERRDAKLEKLELVIIDDAALALDDFVKNAEANEWVAVDEVVKRLKAKYSHITAYDGHKKDYLCALYGRFRGRSTVTWDEAQNAAKAWCQSIAYKPIGSVHDLVRDEILEFDGKQLQESISRISDLMRQVTNLKQEGKRIEATVTHMHKLKSVIGETATAFEQQVKYDLLLAKQHVRSDNERTSQEQQKIADDTELAKQHRAAEVAEKGLREDKDKSRITVAVQLKGIPAHGEKERLENLLSRATLTARTTLELLSRSLLAAAQLDNAARQLIGKPVPDQFPKLKASVQAVADAVSDTALERLALLREAVVGAECEDELNVFKLQALVSAFEGANTGIAAVHGALVGPVDSVAIAIATESSTLDGSIIAAKRARDDLAGKKAHLASGGGNYNHDTKLTLDRIRDDLPQANVQVLCDLVEPASEEWQSAIEGYLDNARFNLIVKPEWEAKTTDFLQARGLRSKVIQGQYCLDRADPARVSQDSITHELRTENPIARAYLIEQYGSVVKVKNVEQLRKTARGLTKDGKASGSRTMFICDQKNLVLGRAARERALTETTGRLVAAELEVLRLEGLKTTLSVVHQHFSKLKEPVFDANPLDTCASEIDHGRRSLSQLDLTEVVGLEIRLAELVQEIEQHAGAMQRAHTEAALADGRVTTAENAIRAIDAQRDSRFAERERQIQRLKFLCEANAEKTYTVMAEEIEDLLTARAIDIAGTQQKLTTLRAAPSNLLGDVRELLAEYNAQARAEERFQSALPHHHEATTFDPYYGPLVVLGRAVNQQLKDMEGIGLYNNRDEVEKAERSFHDVFTKQFCVEIKTKVDDGIRTLKQLNGELQNLKFGSDRFSIDWSKWEREFEDYHGFFKAVTELADSPETIDLFGETELSAKHLEVRDKLVRLLLDPDQERASRELLRIADYRNYRRYEIWNESDSGGRIALSTWGTGSGGQLETPAYIVRAAVVTNRLKFFEKGPSLKLLVNDESFSKMDEQRARAVLRFLRDNLGLQVVSAMPTKAAGGLRDEFTREYSFTRAAVDANGELDFISDCDDRVLKSDRMRELWALQRTQARQQAKLTFEAEEVAGAVEVFK
jgi:P-loop containing region of AAA domain/Putative exonuclease SbcCD, C subunit